MLKGRKIKSNKEGRSVGGKEKRKGEREEGIWERRRKERIFG